MTQHWTLRSAPKTNSLGFCTLPRQISDSFKKRLIDYQNHFHSHPGFGKLHSKGFIRVFPTKFEGNLGEILRYVTTTDR